MLASLFSSSAPAPVSVKDEPQNDSSMGDTVIVASQSQQAQPQAVAKSELTQVTRMS